MSLSPESRAKAAERMRKLNADPEFKAATSERMRKLHADPEFKAKLSERASERMRKLHADPEFKAKLAPLAHLTADERKLYNKMRARGVSRDEALSALSRATKKAAE